MMPTPEGLPSLEEAFGQAVAETGFEEPELGAEAAEETPQPEEVEQPEQEPTAPEEQAPVFDDLLKAEPAPQGIDWNSPVELPGIGQIPLSEMRDGYLRQADYTRKTQQLAAERKAFKEEHGQALKLWDSLIKDPAGTAAYVAVQTGVIDEQAVAGKVRALQSVWKPPPSREEVEADMEKRVAEAVANHPAVVEAQQQTLLASVDREFAQVEKKHGIKLTDRDKAVVLKQAIDSGTNDLGLVVESMLHRQERIRRERESAREAATPRPGVRPSSPDTPAKVNTIDDAFNLALLELAGGGG